MRKTFEHGDVVRHFKYETLSEEEQRTYKYIYVVLHTATHTETGEQLIVYRPFIQDGTVYVRPLNMFMSKVDKEKYPDIQQEYRFEEMYHIVNM